MKLPANKTELWYLDESTNSYTPLSDSSSLPVNVYSQGEDVEKSHRSTEIPPSVKVELYYFDTESNLYRPLVVDGKLPVTMDGGGGTDPTLLDISEVPYDINNDTSKSLKEILDDLLYIAPAINSFNVNTSVAEKGTSLTGLTLSWSINKDVVEQRLSRSSAQEGMSIEQLDVDIRTHAITGTIVFDTNFILHIDDGKNLVSKSLNVSFRNKLYYGVSALTSLTNSDILSLSGELATARTKTATFNPSNQYIYFVFPTSFGTPSFKVNGLTNDAWVVTTITHVNSQGFSEAYTIYRSQYEQNGVNIIIDVT